MSDQTLATIFESWNEKLNAGYDRLLGLIRSEASDPDELARALQETGELLLMARQATISGTAGFSQEQLVQLQQKVDLLMTTIRREQARLRTGMGKVKQGRRAMVGYNPRPYGMGFTEGKFIDSKK